MQETTAVVVTYNSDAEIGPCLDALRGRARALVVDNGSTDGTLERARERTWVEVVANGRNAGFAAAVNQGARLASGGLLLVLNPDAVVTTDLGPLAEACRMHGIAAGCLTEPNGSPQAGFAVRSLPTPAALILECLGINRMWASNPINRHYRCLGLDHGKPGFIEQPAGAFLMIRSDVFDRLGGFDESFWPVWFEDVDFCQRAARAGYRIAYVPEVRAIHAGGHSVKNSPTVCQRLYWYDSLLKYARKHFSGLAFRALCLAVIAGSLGRSLAGIFNWRARNPFAGHHQVIRMAAATLVARRVVYPQIEMGGGDGVTQLKSRAAEGRCSK